MCLAMIICLQDEQAGPLCSPMTRRIDAPNARQFSRLTADQLTGICCALLVVVLFSSFTLTSRLGRRSEMGIEDLAALRFGIGALVLLPVFLKHGLAGLTLLQAVRLAFLGGVGFALFAYAGFFLAPASHGAVLLHGVLPLVTFVITFTMTQTPASRRGFTGIAVMALGIALMVIDSISSADRWQLLGDACLLAAAICWAAYGITVQQLAISPLRSAAIVAVLSMLIFWPIYLPLTGASGLIAASLEHLLLQGIFQGMLIGAASILVYTRAVATLGASGTALFTSLVPCLTTFLAVPLLGEVPGPDVLIGVATVSIGMITAVMARRPGLPLSNGCETESQSEN
jgi:drug/metabolite transporter (DMT)-like permease